MTPGLDLYTEPANRESSYDLLKGFASKHWDGLTEQQALLIDITVMIINGGEPIVGDFKGFLQKRKSKEWFAKHQDEVFTTFLCVVIDIFGAWNHVDDIFNEKIRLRFNSTYNDFFMRNWSMSDEQLSPKHFFLRVGKKWHDSLSGLGVKVNIPDIMFGNYFFVSNIHGILAYLETMGGFSSGQTPSAMIDWFAQTTESTKPTADPNVDAALPPPQPVEQDSIPRFTGSADKQYDGWVEHCMLIARMQRLPERLAVDLIPPKEVAHHFLIDLDQREAEYEKTMPGRRQWLVDEGVSRADFDKFWGSPAWVQNFVEELVNRQMQLEFQGHIKDGNPEDKAAAYAAFFIPTYATWPSRPGAEHQDLPFELFERVRVHMALVDNDKYQEEMIANKLHEANAYIRMKIKTHQI